MTIGDAKNTLTVSPAREQDPALEKEVSLIWH